MNNCIFCNIVNKKTPCFKIFENDEFMAFLDIYPRTFGHTLVIPKKHYRWINDLSQEEFIKCWDVVYKVTKALENILETKFITYGTHGLEIEHAHIHILPRKNEKEFLPEIIQVKKEELEILTNKLTSFLK